MGSFLTRLAAKVEAATPRGVSAPRPSLGSLAEAVIAAAPMRASSTRPAQTAAPAALPRAEAATPPRVAALSLTSLAEAVVAAAPVRASSTRPAPTATPATRPRTGAATPPPAAARSIAAITAAVVAATPSATAPSSSTRTTAPSVRAGTRISFLGDTANSASDGTVTTVDGAYFWGRLDNGQTLLKQPIALLSTPRWRVLASAPTPSVRAPRSAAPTSLAAVAAAVESVAPAPSRRAPGSLKVADLDEGWTSPPTQRAPAAVTTSLAAVAALRGAHEHLVADAAHLGAHEPPPGDPAPPLHLPIASLHDLVALPVGPRLRLVRSEHGEASSRRELIAVTRKELRLRIADPADKDHGKVVRHALTKRIVVQPRSQGFALVRLDHAKEPRWVEADYVFDEAGDPLSVGTWRATLAQHEKTETAAERRTRFAQTREWLEDARRAYQQASTPAAEAKALRDLDDAQALHTATSLRELNPGRLARLIEATRTHDARLHAWLVSAEEQGVYGVPSAQVALFQREAAAIGAELDRIGKGRIDPIRERIRRAVAMVRHARGDGTELQVARAALREALDARKAARAGHTADVTSTDQAAAAVVEHRAEALSQRLDAKAPCATDEGVLAATLGAYRTSAEIATVLGCDVAAVEEVLARLDEQHKLRKTFPKDKPTRWGHDVPPWNDAWAVHRDGDRIYGDTSFLTAAGRLPSFLVRHLGFGEFTLDTPQGEVEFNRFAGVDFPGQTGRSHLLEGKPEALALLLQEMHVDERLAEEAQAAPTALPEAVATHLLEKVSTEGTPEEFAQKKSRTEANLAAMQLAATLRREPRPPSNHELLVLGSYSGWGGLSIQEAESRFPADFPRPETRGLIHEYYTSARVCAEVARVLKPLLPALATAGGGSIAALEPSAGIGRFIRACEGPGFEAVDWHAVEYSAVSAALLRAMRPELDLFEGPFERWVTEHEDEYAGRLQLVVSNPPYGKRGAAEVEDTNVAYRTKRADTYFLRRGLDLLAKDGIGVYLVPLGFLSATSDEAVSLRKDVLRRHHLACAYRLPSDLFPQALVTVDLIFFRARGGSLAAVDTADEGLLQGKYFLENPTHVLGTVKEGGGRYGGGYEVVGEFTTLPDFRERPLCSTCVHTPFTPAKAPAKPRGKALALLGLASRLQAASSLGTRLIKLLAGIAAQESELPFLAWDELQRALLDWSAAHGAPSLDKDLLLLAKDGQDPGAQKFLTAFARGSTALVQALTSRPAWTPRYTGAAGDVVAHAEFTYRQRRKLARSEVADTDVGKLFAAGWAEDEPGELVPPDVYFSGDLWPKYDRARVRAEDGSVQAGAQLTQLLALIKPALFDDIGGVSPQQGWIPLHLVEGWIQSISKSGSVRLERKDGLVQIVGTSYDELEGGWRHDVANVLGWINHDRALFRPQKQKADEDDIDMARSRVAREWEQAFRAWCSADETRRITIEQAYQRSFQGYHPSTYSVDPLPLARWGKAVQLRPHQNAGARRVLANRGGLIAFDVGVGKTYTGCAILAAARQEGWAKRPVILVPNSIVWNWVAELARALPDYRVGVIGANRKTIKQGPKAGYQTSETDTPEERAEKWTRFQAGEFDVMLVTYSSFARTKLGEQDIIAYVDATSAIERQLALRHRNAWKASGAGDDDAKKKKRKKATKLSERQEAILEEGTAGWVAEKLELPESWQYDPGISWNDLGVDLLLVDEAQNFKNLYLPEAREHGVPKFMGAAGEGSNRAWQLDFRAMTVRKRSGGAGIVLLSATPAKNSPLEFYNLIQYVDHEAFARLGILDPEQFIDRYCKILTREVVTMNATVEPAAACVGFRELHELRDLIFRYGEFVTGDDVEKAGAQARNLTWRALVDEHGSSVEEIARVWGWGKTDVDKGLLVGRGQVPVDRPDDAPGAVEQVEAPRAKSDRRRAALAAQVLANGRTWLQLLESVCVRVGVPLAIGLDDGLKLPKPWVRRIELEGNEVQTQKRNAYKEAIEAKLENSGSQDSKSLLGMLASLSLVGIHPALDERREVTNDAGDVTNEPIWTWETAEDVATPHSPKLDAVAAEIMKRPGCGHIVFVENIAVHVWLRMVLIEAGMPRERIAILNAASGNPNRSPADRQRIAQEFNGSPAGAGTDGALGEPEILPKYDVIIANQVAYEGINLQTRTCAVHHVDMPWEPATLQQRNGRAWRQGNEFLAIQIIYYMARCFPDGMKFNMIQGKRGWMADLLESQARETNNPGAQMEVGPEEVLAMLACDATAVRAMFVALKEKAAAEARVKQAAAASTSLRGAVSRFQRAAVMRNPIEAARLRAEGQQRIDDLQHVDPKAWPWAEWAKQARDHAMLVPENGGSPVYETLRTATPDFRDPSVLNYDEYGKTHEGTTIALRTAGKVKWRPLSMNEVVGLNLQPESVSTTWPQDDESRMTEAMRLSVDELRHPARTLKAWAELNWKDATDSFQERAWRLFGGQITLALRELVGVTYWTDNLLVPVMRGGTLEVGLLRPFDSIIALSPAGWEDFLTLAPVSNVRFEALEQAAKFWWGRLIPRDLLSAVTPEQEAARAGALQRAKERARIEREQAERDAAEAAERQRKEEAEEEERERKAQAERAREREERIERERVARQERQQEHQERKERERTERAENEARQLATNPHATFRVSGDTWPRRHDLGAIPGAYFDRVGKQWIVPLALAAQARRIMGQD